MERFWLAHHQAGFAKTSRVVIAAGVIAAITLVASTLACRAAKAASSSAAGEPSPITETAAP